MSRRQFYIKRELRGETVEQYMVTDLDTVSPGATIQEFIDDHLFHTYHQMYPVHDEGNTLLGVITIQKIKEIGKEKWDNYTVNDLMIPIGKVQTLSPETDVFQALSTFNEASTESLLVAKDNKLAGLLSAKDLSKVISLKLDLEEEGF